MDGPETSLRVGNIEKLKTAVEVRRGVEDFASRVLETYTGNLSSIFAFGSVVTGDVDEQSDVNLMVVFSALDIAELKSVAPLSQEWLQKQRFAPRFISKGNLEESARYFQVDFLEMRDAHVLLWGEELLSDIEISPRDLRWQIAYELKSMRMRLKQQFWRSAGDPEQMRLVLVHRFLSLIHLMRAMILLAQHRAPVTRAEILAAAGTHLKIDSKVAESFLRLRRDALPPLEEDLTPMFTQLMDMIRTLDTRLAEVKP